MGWTIALTDSESGEQTTHTFSQVAILVGRASECDLVVEQKSVTRQHTRLKHVGNDVRVEDLSRQGTTLRTDNGYRRLSSKRVFHSPVSIELGKYMAELAFEQEPIREPGPAWDQSVVIPPGKLATMREAILVFDLRASSQIANEDDHMACHLKQRLTQIAEPVLDAQNRRFLKSTGDGFLAC